MRKGKLFNRKTVQLLMTAVSLSAALVVGGCGSGGGGSDSYDTPAGTVNAPVNGAETNVLLDSATLASWIKNGQVASSASFDGKVVILDYGVYDMENPENSPERIKGACRVHNNDLRSRRVEGVAEAFPMVATGEQMDAVIQRLGIDKDTTIVFTTDSWIPEWTDDEFSMYFATRAYWMFRYWGFPKENLKMLNGGNDAFAAAYPELMTMDVPTPQASDFSVGQLDGDLQGDLRLSIADMLGLVADLDASTDVVLDARPGPFAGEGTSPAYTSSKGDKVVYDGHSEGVQTLSWMSLFVDPANGDYNFKTKAEIEALFAAKGWSTDKMTTVYCTSGYSATPLFFAIDSILDGKVRLYDGSWTQYGMYSDVEDAGGELPLGSAWATDQYLDLSGGYRYNIDYLPADPLAIEAMVIDDAAQAQPFSGDVDGTSDINASQMEIADLAAAPFNAAPVMTAPSATDTGSDVLISAAKLQEWVDADLINADSGERVVILDASYKASFDDGHIDGARLLGVESDNNQNGMGRVDGVMLTANMLLTAEKMDALFESHGIDENTTIVITTSEMSENYYPSRVYTNLRYWGFPKNRIKVLDGYNHAFATKLVEGAEPAAGASFITVAELAGVQLDLRATLSEVMDAARDMRGDAIDFRGDTNHTGVTPGLMNDTSDFVVFEGKLNNGKFYGRGNAVNADGTFKTATAIKQEMLANGIDVDGFTAPAIAYCTSGYAASTGFFVMDGILGADAMIYDGSWSQWGQMSANAEKGGLLVTADDDFSAWAVDSDTYMSSIKYNMDNTKNVESLNPDAELLKLDPVADADAANQVENADEDYKNATTAPAEPATPPTAGDGGGPVGC